MTTIKSPGAAFSPYKSRTRILLSTALLVVLAVIMWSSSSSSSSSAAGALSCAVPKIQYKVVEEQTTTNNANGFRYTRYAAYCKDQPATIQMWAHSLAHNAYQAEPLIAIIREKSEYKGVFWETKGCSPQNWATKKFEFVLVDAPELADFAEPSPDVGAFQEHFASCRDSYGCSFSNIGGDAHLVAPKPLSESSATSSSSLTRYSHLAAFCRHAPHDQVMLVWSMAAKEFETRMKNQMLQNSALWFSTAGMGIPWLHFRIDNRPKYYRFHAFSQES